MWALRGRTPRADCWFLPTFCRLIRKHSSIQRLRKQRLSPAAFPKNRRRSPAGLPSCTSTVQARYIGLFFSYWPPKNVFGLPHIYYDISRRTKVHSIIIYFCSIGVPDLWQGATATNCQDEPFVDGGRQGTVSVSKEPPSCRAEQNPRIVKNFREPEIRQKKRIFRFFVVYKYRSEYNLDLTII